MKNLRTFIDAIGRPQIMQALGVKTAAITNWIARGQIPPEHSAVLGKLASAQGVDCPESLFGFTPAATSDIATIAPQIKAAAK